MDVIFGKIEKTNT